MPGSRRRKIATKLERSPEQASDHISKTLLFRVFSVVFTQK
jgi:hypothetical protein